MKELIRKVAIDIQFRYPCITTVESSSDNEFIILAETKLRKVYPIHKSVDGMTPIGEDYWGRYTFKDENEQYYCELDGDLYFKGNDPEGEPHYPVKKVIHYDFPDIDNELIEFKPFIDKVRAYINDETDLTLEDVNTSLKLNSDNMLESKIYCYYKFKLL